MKDCEMKLRVAVVEKVFHSQPLLTFVPASSLGGRNSSGCSIGCKAPQSRGQLQAELTKFQFSHLLRSGRIKS